MLFSHRSGTDPDIVSVRAGARRTSAIVLVGSVVWLAVFGMGSRATACELTDPTCVVDEVGETVEDVQEEANETIDEAQETANETLNNVKETVDEVVNPGNPAPPNPPSEPTVPGNPGGPDNGPGKRPGDKGQNGPANVKSEQEERARGPRRLAGPLLPPITLAVGPLLRDPFGFNDAGRPADPGLVESAIEAAKDFVFPLVLTIIVGAFLTIQHRVDRRDPKLVFAPIGHDLLSFE